ncbi:ion channel [Roseiarcaceae bacterium H3SJ34-1]|uniref:ion channel n=1 Tax=Terripilifer ovatus TaxID=3032367 RepID=UPI003AB940FF|nr:ion channel [Roseiarcaceae bacterium H3SJ34-1]
MIPSDEDTGHLARHRRRIFLGDREIVIRGFQTNIIRDFYHYAMRASWPVFFAGFAVAFLSLNFLFSLLYSLGVNPIANVREGSFTDLFFFSIETLATVGYGDMHPQTTFGHSIATVEIFTGMSIVAVMTGLVFARFSRPKAQIVFARAPAVAVYDGRMTLMVRFANARHNFISDASASLWLTRLETTVEGKTLRRFHPLVLERAQNPLFALSWTLMHVIDETSLLYHATADSLAQVEAGLIVTVRGLDEQSAQDVFARHFYNHSDLRWDHHYVDILTTDDENRTVIDYLHFHDTQPVEIDADALPVDPPEDPPDRLLEPRQTDLSGAAEGSA